jgi:hypothetical protein
MLTFLLPTPVCFENFTQAIKKNFQCVRKKRFIRKLECNEIDSKENVLFPVELLTIKGAWQTIVVGGGTRRYVSTTRPCLLTVIYILKKKKNSKVFSHYPLMTTKKTNKSLIMIKNAYLENVGLSARTASLRRHRLFFQSSAIFYSCLKF